VVVLSDRCSDGLGHRRSALDAVREQPAIGTPPLTRGLPSRRRACATAELPSPPGPVSSDPGEKRVDKLTVERP